MIFSFLFFYLAILSSKNSRYELTGYPESLKLVRIQTENFLLISSKRGLISCMAFESKQILWQKEFYNIVQVKFTEKNSIILENFNNISKLIIINNEIGNIIYQKNFVENFIKFSLKGEFIYLFSHNNVIFFDLLTYNINSCDINYNHKLGYVFDDNVFKFYTFDNGIFFSYTCEYKVFKNIVEIGANFEDLGKNTDNCNNYKIDEFGVVFKENNLHKCTIGAISSILTLSTNYACASLKTLKLGAKFIIIPFLSEIIDNVIIIDKILNIISNVNLTKPVFGFNLLENEDFLLFSHNIDKDTIVSSFVLTKNEIQLVNYVKIRGLTTEILDISYNFNLNNDISEKSSNKIIKIFPLTYGNSVFVMFLTSDKFLHFSDENGFKKYADISLSEISTYALITPEESEESVSKLDTFFEIYSSINGILPKFIFRLKFSLGLIFDALSNFKYQYVIDIFYKIRDGQFSITNTQKEFHASIISLSNDGILQRIHSEDFSIFWRKNLFESKSLNLNILDNVKLFEFNINKNINCMIASGCSNSFLYIYIFDPLNGKDCLDILLRDYDIFNAKIVGNAIQVDWKTGNSLNKFNNQIIIIDGNSTRVLISPKDTHCQKKYYHTIGRDYVNLAVNGFMNNCDRSISSFLNIWTIICHENSSYVKLINDEQLYTVDKDNRVVVEKYRLYSHSHRGYLLLTYIYTVNSISYFHLKYINALNGAVLFDLTRRSCSGPTFVELYQRYIFVVYSNQYSANELLVVEIMKNLTDSELIIKVQNYILDIPPIISMSVTKTKLGLKYPTLLLGSQGHIYALPSNLISARRSLNPSKEELEDGLLAYVPIISPNEMMRLNKNYTLYNIKSIVTSHANVESASYFCAFSTSTIYCDLFKGIMEDGFDSLSSRFDPQLMLVMQIILTISTIGIIYYYYRSQRKDLWE